MKEKITTEVLIMGKSGSGKSSLLNYLFEENKMRTGAGRGVTGKNIYRSCYDYKESFSIGIWDSWGIEPARYAEWEKLILAKIKEREGKSIKEWFNTIIFCTSLGFDRIEESEIKLIKSLRRENHQILIAITHCTEENYDKFRKYQEKIRRETGIGSEKIIAVSSVSKKTLGGKEIIPFGKEKVIATIIDNLWETYIEKVPKKIEEKALENIDSKTAEIVDMVNKKYFWFAKSAAINKLEEKIRKDLTDFLKEIGRNIDREFDEVFDYYEKLTNHFLDILVISEMEMSSIAASNSDILKDFNKKSCQDVKEMMRIFRSVLKPLDNEDFIETMGDFWVSFKIFLSKSKKIKESLTISIHGNMNQIKVELRNLIKKRVSKMREVVS